MIRIGTVWDRTTEVIGGRFALLAGIALLLLAAPAVVQGVVAALAGPDARVLTALLNLIVLVFTMWGSLSIVAMASDPTVDRPAALGIGARRLPAGLGVLALTLLVVVLAALPGLALFATSGFDMERARAGLPQDGLDAGRVMLATLYFLVLGIVGLWLSARLTPLFAVVVNERRGLGAFRRAFDLTRGSALKLIGVLLLYAIVVIVVLAAATTVVGTIARLLAGADGAAIVAISIAIVTALVTATFGVLQYAFTAQFYLAARDVFDSK